MNDACIAFERGTILTQRKREVEESRGRGILFVLVCIQGVGSRSTGGVVQGGSVEKGWNLQGGEGEKQVLELLVKVLEILVQVLKAEATGSGFGDTGSGSGDTGPGSI